MTTLTDEQRELIRQNRERALAIQREKKRQREEEQESKLSAANELGVAATTTRSPEKRLRNDNDNDNFPSVAGTVERNDDAPPVLRCTSTIIDPARSRSARKSAAPAGGATTDGLSRTTTNKDDGNNDDDDDKESLEDFEIGASEFVTRQDAMKLYCLPTGTLDVCQYVERPNPRHASWKPMRLYHRKEIRRRARQRFGGRAGLVQERQQRADKRLSNDLAKASQLFR
jgi:hypothetical protein